jgi:hypothetical protein
MDYIYVIKENSMDVARIDVTKHLNDTLSKYRGNLQHVLFKTEKTLAPVKNRYVGWVIKIIDPDFDIYNLNKFLRHTCFTTKIPYEVASIHSWATNYKFTGIDKLLEFLDTNNVKYECKDLDFGDYSLEYNKTVVEEEEQIKLNKLNG